MTGQVFAFDPFPDDLSEESFPSTSYTAWAYFRATKFGGARTAAYLMIKRGPAVLRATMKGIMEMRARGTSYDDALDDFLTEAARLIKR